MRKLILFGLICLVMAGGCTHKTVVNVPYGMGVYSSYEEKIPGKWAILINTDVSSLNREVSPASYLCSAWTFPLQFSATFETAVLRASEHIFEHASKATQVPTQVTLLNEGYRGYVIVSLKHFEPRLQFTAGFWSGKAHASADIGIEFSVKDIDGKTVMASMSSASKTVDGDSGNVCQKGADCLADATMKATREMLEGYIERISNSEKLRSSMPRLAGDKNIYR